MNAVGCSRVLALAVLSFALAGCAPVGYVIPAVTSIPSVPLDAPADQVRAFRIDCTTSTENAGSVGPISRCRCTLHPVEPDFNGTLPPQKRYAVNYSSGWLFFPALALSDWHSSRSDSVVRLYRPGYQIVEVGAQSEPDQPPAWKPANGAEEQEKAIDALLAASGPYRKEIERHPRLWSKEDPDHPDLDRTWAHLAGGSSGKEQREALRYAAGEYERLGKLVTAEEARSRLAAKAAWLRKLAER